MKVLKYHEFLKETIKSTQRSLYTEMLKVDYSMKDKLFAGGAYGHLQHPYDNLDLSFKDLQEMIDISISGSFSPENFVQEKTDGMNIMFTWKGEELRAARNKGHIKNFGKNALTKQEISQKFEGRGEIHVAFTQAINDLENAISMLRQSDRQNIFEEGKKFMSVEIIYPSAQNIIPYGMSMLVFHGTNEYDKEGNIISQDKKSAKVLANIIAEINEDVQDTFYIRGPLDLNLKPLPNLSQKKSYYTKRLNTIMKKFNLKSNNKLEDYIHAQWKKYISDNFSDFSENLKEQLFNRWCLGDKTSVNMHKLKSITTDEELEQIKNFEKKEINTIHKQVRIEFEYLFLELGTDILSNITDFLSVIPDKATKMIINDIQKVIREVKSSKDASSIQKLEAELLRLEKSGGLQRVVPSEGITFVYKDKLYKYTGLFASINQITGILKY